MKEKKEYSSAVRSRRLIRQAFVELLQEKELQKITVADIVKRAEINRSTFYVHYPDVRGLVEVIENEIIDEMMVVLGTFDYESFFENPTAPLLCTSHFLGEKQDFYRALLKSKDSVPFLEKLKEIFIHYMKNDTSIPKEIRESKSFSIRISSLAGGLSNPYLEWFRGELDCTLEDIALEMGKVIKGAVQDLIRR